MAVPASLSYTQQDMGDNCIMTVFFSKSVSL